MRRDLMRELQARRLRLSGIVKRPRGRLERVPVAVIEQLERCKDNAARRLLMQPHNARKGGC